jgi:hypothetical protein
LLEGEPTTSLADAPENAQGVARHPARTESPSPVYPAVFPEQAHECADRPRTLIKSTLVRSVPRIVNPQVWPAYAERFEQTFGFRPQG